MTIHTFILSKPPSRKEEDLANLSSHQGETHPPWAQGEPGDAAPRPPPGPLLGRRPLCSPGPAAPDASGGELAGKEGLCPLLRGSPAEPKNVLARALQLSHDTRQKLSPLELDRWLVSGIQGRSSASKRSSHRDQTCLSSNLCVPTPLLHVAGFMSPSTHAST